VLIRPVQLGAFAVAVVETVSVEVGTIETGSFEVDSIEAGFFEVVSIEAGLLEIEMVAQVGKLAAQVYLRVSPFRPVLLG
jgi:hypothetical protein